MIRRALSIAEASSGSVARNADAHAARTFDHSPAAIFNLRMHPQPIQSCGMSANIHRLQWRTGHGVPSQRTPSHRTISACGSHPLHEYFSSFGTSGR